VHVKSDYIDDQPRVKQFRERPSFYKNENLKNLLVKDNMFVEYDILNIDSLGNYINIIFAKNFFQFRLYNDTLKISAGPGEMLTPKFADWTKREYLNLTFDRPVTNVIKTNKKIYSKNNQVVILMDRKQLKQEGIEVKIVFGK
jgi:hypothetical protein